MASAPNTTQIPPPRMQLLDPRTGLITREWYLWFLNLYNLTGGGSSAVSINDLLLTPLASDELAPAFDALQSYAETLPSALAMPAAAENVGPVSGAEIAPLVTKIEGLELAPVAQPAPLPISGTYTPTLTNVANIDTSTANPCMYVRNGRIVSVWGAFSVDPTTGGIQTDLGVSLPIPSALSAIVDLAGNVTGYGVNTVGSALADVANARANLRFLPFDAADRAIVFNFSYVII